MKTVPPLIAVILCALAFATQAQEPAVEIESVRTRYARAFEEISASEAAGVAPLTATYLQELTRLRTAAQTRGDLNGVVAFDALIAAAKSGPPAPPRAAASPAVHVAYQTYQRNKLNAIRLLMLKREQLEAAYARDLTALEQQFTRTGQIEAAKLAREAKTISPNVETEVLPAFTGLILNTNALVSSEKSYKPPLEIEFRFTTDGEVRFAYACEQIILNWPINPSELRIDGGPVSGQHKKGQGTLAKNQPVTVKLAVTPKLMTLAVDGRERGRWSGDFSNVDQPVRLRAPNGAVVKVDQAVVRKLK